MKNSWFSRESRAKSLKRVFSQGISRTKVFSPDFPSETFVREMLWEKAFFSKVCARDSIYKALKGLIDKK
jgi:hypothetical protein